MLQTVLEADFLIFLHISFFYFSYGIVSHSLSLKRKVWLTTLLFTLGHEFDLIGLQVCKFVSWLVCKFAFVTGTKETDLMPRKLIFGF
jgi:hypothetical protein